MESKLQKSRCFRLFVFVRAILMSVSLIMISGCECCLDFDNDSEGRLVGDYKANNQGAGADTGGWADGTDSGDPNNVDDGDVQIGPGEHEELDLGYVEDVGDIGDDVSEQGEDIAEQPGEDVGVGVDVGSGDPADVECSNEFAVEVLALVNAARAENGKRAVRCDPLLRRAARLHAEDMCAQDYFSHTSKDGRRMVDRMNAEGVQFRAAGENIAKGQQSSQAAHTSWMNSPGHRANILSDKYDRLGVGHAQCTSGRYWVQDFAG